MKKHIIEPGMKLGRLTVLRLSTSTGIANRKIFVCRCQCGSVREIPRDYLARGTSSCGCLRREVARLSNTTHGLSRHPIHESWNSMINRCRSKDPQKAIYYLDRGITVCDEWKDFQAFYNDMAPTWKPGLWIERRNNDLGYSRFNCTWATPKEQARNRRSNRLIEHDGEIKTMAEWASVYGMKLNVLFCRLRSGWSIEKALTRPLRTWPGPVQP